MRPTNDSRDALLSAIQGALSQMSTTELHLFTLAVLHGVPVARLSGSPQANIDLLIGAQKKLRKQMSDGGFSSSAVEKAYTQGH